MPQATSPLGTSELSGLQFPVLESAARNLEQETRNGKPSRSGSGDVSKPVLWKFGDNINTDFITPGRYNLTTDAQELAKIAFIEYRPEFSKNVKNGDILVAGENFGCGSSRETAATALKACGLQAVIAKSFARIFYRNSINVGLPLITLDASTFEESDVVEIDFENNLVRNNTKNTELSFESGPLVKRILAEGGIIPYIKKNGLDSLRRLSE